jgi:hypothetical protein
VKPATEILLSVAFALTPKENWTQHAVARTTAGHLADADAPHAASWCLVGALIEANKALGVDRYMQAHDALCDAVGGSFINFNNTRTHKQVLRAIYKAAELSEGP